MRCDQKLLRGLQGWWQGKVGKEWVMGTRERESEEAERALVSILSLLCSVAPVVVADRL